MPPKFGQVFAIISSPVTVGLPLFLNNATASKVAASVHLGFLGVNVGDLLLPPAEPVAGEPIKPNVKRGAFALAGAVLPWVVPVALPPRQFVMASFGASLAGLYILESVI